MKAQVFTGISYNTIYAHDLTNYRNDSKRSLAGFRFRKFIRTKLFKALVIIALPFYMLFLFGQKKEIGLMVAVGMSAALLAPITFA